MKKLLTSSMSLGTTECTLSCLCRGSLGTARCVQVYKLQTQPEYTIPMGLLAWGVKGTSEVSEGLTAVYQLRVHGLDIGHRRLGR